MEDGTARRRWCRARVEPQAGAAEKMKRRGAVPATAASVPLQPTILTYRCLSCFMARENEDIRFKNDRPSGTRRIDHPEMVICLG